MAAAKINIDIYSDLIPQTPSPMAAFQSLVSFSQANLLFPVIPTGAVTSSNHPQPGKRCIS
jgi:hypothetical protein